VAVQRAGDVVRIGSEVEEVEAMDSAGEVRPAAVGVEPVERPLAREARLVIGLVDPSGVAGRTADPVGDEVRIGDIDGVTERVDVAMARAGGEQPPPPPVMTTRSPGVVSASSFTACGDSG
jgi:hypothetical protein